MSPRALVPLCGPFRGKADALHRLIEEGIRRLGSAGLLVEDKPQRRYFAPLSAEKRAAIVAAYQSGAAAGARVSLVKLARAVGVHVNTVRKLTRPFRVAAPKRRARAKR
jgi:hypothetical protein